MDFDLSDSLMRSFKPPNIRNALDWSNRYARLPPGDAFEGPFKARKVQEDILKDCSLGNRRYASGQRIREVGLLKASQVGATKCSFNIFGYHIHSRPGNIALYLANPDSVKAYSGGIFAKWLDAQDSLDGIVKKEVTSDGKSSSSRKIFRGGILNFLSGNLARDVASHSFQLVVADELDSFPDDIKNEGNPMDLIRNRVKEYANGLLIWISTPRGTYSQSKIWDFYQSSDRCRFMIICPECGKAQWLSHKQLVVNHPYHESGFQCINQDCGFLMKEEHKHALLEKGYWKPTSDAGIPGRRGYYLPSFYSTSPTMTWGNIARLKEEAGYSKEKLVAFLNTICGLPASNARDNAINPAEILEFARHHSTYKTVVSPAEPIPNDISYIACGVDCQSSEKKGRLEVQFWGFSRDYDYFLNHCELLGSPFEDDVFDGLSAITDVIYTTEDGLKQVKPSIVLIDAGEGRLSNRIYSVCRKHRLWHPYRGHSIPNKPMVVKTKIPQSGERSAFQIYYSVQASVTKDDLHNSLRSYLDKDPEGRLRLPDDIDSYVAEGFCSEYRTVKRVANYDKVLWIHNKSVPNEPLDCACMARAGAASYLDLHDPTVLWPRLDKECSTDRPKKKVKRVFNQHNWDI